MDERGNKQLCIAVPVRVIEVEGDRATIEVAGGSKVVSKKLVPDVKPGEYGLLHAGFIIQKVDPGQARQTLKLFGEIYGHATSS